MKRGNVKVEENRAALTLDNLRANTRYLLAVQAKVDRNRYSADRTEVNLTTDEAGKWKHGGSERGKLSESRTRS